MNNPTSSTLNFPVGDDRGQRVTVALNPPGVFSINLRRLGWGRHGPTSSSDVTGYYVPDANGSTFVALNPTRILDTRNGTGGPVGTLQLSTRRASST